MNSRHKVPFDEEVFGFLDAMKIIREWNASDTYPFMRKNTANYLAPRLALWVSLAAVALHWYWATSSQCSFHFARSGAVLVLASALAYGWISWHDPKTMHLSGGKISNWALFNPLFMLPFLGFVGTIIWGYGDLLPFGKSC
jgi:hypothetical protein